MLLSLILGTQFCEVAEDICGKETVTRYVCPDGETITLNPLHCPITTTPTTTIVSTTIPPASTLTTIRRTTTSLMLTFCTGRSTGSYCDGILRVECSNGLEVSEKDCITVLKPIMDFTGNKPTTYWLRVPGECRTNDAGAECYDKTL